MNEGFLGKYTFGGERAATDDHPAVIHYLPLAASVAEKLDVGLLLKAVDVYGAPAVVGAENTGGTAARVTPGALAAMRHVVYGDPKPLFSFALEEAALGRMAAACEDFLLKQLDRGFATLDFYRRLTAYGA